MFYCNGLAVCKRRVISLVELLNAAPQSSFVLCLLQVNVRTVCLVKTTSVRLNVCQLRSATKLLTGF